MPTYSSTKFIEFGYELFPHPSYSPDLAPVTIFWLSGKRVSSNHEVIAQTIAFFRETLADVYGAERRLPWEIKRFSVEKPVFLFLKVITGLFIIVFKRF